MKPAPRACAVFPRAVNSCRLAFNVQRACVTLLALLALPCAARPAVAQTASGSLDVPQTRLAPLGSAPGMPPPSAFPPPGSSFDPYSGAPASGFINPASPTGMGVSSPGLGVAPQGGYFPPATPPTATYGTPYYGGLANQPPPMLDFGGLFGGNSALGGGPVAVPPGSYAGPAFGGAPSSYGYPPSALPNSAPSSLFPSGFWGTSPSYPTGFDPYRIIQRIRFRHTFLWDDSDPDALEINDTDVALAFAFPRFLFSNQPLYVIPSFSLHLWNGPESSTGADLPAEAYSGFVGFAWQSDPNRIVGAEIAVDVGAFSEFDVFTDDSIRVRGKGLGTFRLTPTTTLKAGIYYYDRVRTKLLPAFGFISQPSPFKRCELFFPQPKFSHYLSTLGTQDVWWYLSGDYGGGSWTIERDDGREDQADINDIRVMVGFEAGESQRMRAGLRTWFFEFGYVFDREIVYRNNPQDNLALDSTWMIRLGIGY